MEKGIFLTCPQGKKRERKERSSPIGRRSKARTGLFSEGDWPSPLLSFPPYGYSSGRSHERVHLVWNDVTNTLMRCVEGRNGRGLAIRPRSPPAAVKNKTRNVVRQLRSKSAILSSWCLPIFRHVIHTCTHTRRGSSLRTPDDHIWRYTPADWRMSFSMTVWTFLKIGIELVSFKVEWMWLQIHVEDNLKNEVHFFVFPNYELNLH